MAGKFLLRGKDDQDNPVAPRVYWLGATLGRLVAYLQNGLGARTTFISLLAEGARFIGDTGCKRLTKVMYAGFDLPEFDATGQRNWKFHPGTIPQPPAYQRVTAADDTADTLTIPSHTYPVGTIVAFQKRGKDEVSKLPAPLVPHTKYKLRSVAGSTVQLETLAGAAIELTDAGTGPGTWFIYAADNIGLFDTVQGRPEFFPTLNFNFPGLSYIEMALPTELSTGEDEPTRLQIVMDGKMVRDYELVDGVLAPTGDPISGENNALVAYDVLRYDGNRAASRFHGPSWIQWRDDCDEVIPWDGGNENPAPPSSFPVLSGCTWSEETATLTNSSGGAKAVTVPFTVANSSIEAMYHGGSVDFAIVFTSDAAGTFQLHGLIVQPDNDLYFTNGVSVTLLGKAYATDRLKIAYEFGVFKAYKNSIPLDLSAATVPGQLAGNFYCAIFVPGPVANIVDHIAILPSGTASAPREIRRFRGGLVLAEKTPIIDAFESEIHLAPGTSWQDVDGEIVILNGPDRTPVFTFVADPNAGVPTNASRVNVEANDPRALFNYFRYSYRDADHPILERKYVFTDRPLHRKVYGLNQTSIIPYGVMRQSQMERIGESRARLTTDLPFGFTIDAFLDSIVVAKGDFVEVVAPESGYTEASPCLCMVNREATNAGSDVESRQFKVQVITGDFYSDTAHGPVTPGTHTNISGQFIPPPPLVSLVLEEGGELLPDGTFISKIIGLATFAPASGQRGRVQMRVMHGAGYVVTPVHTTDEFTVPGAIAALQDTAVTIAGVPPSGVIPAALDTDKGYILRFSSGDWWLEDPATSARALFSENGTSPIRIYPYSAWVDTGVIIYPNPATMQAPFQVMNIPAGLVEIRVVTETLAGVSSG